MKAMIIDDEHQVGYRIPEIRRILGENGFEDDDDYHFLGRSISVDLLRASLERLSVPPDIAIIDYYLNWSDTDGNLYNGDAIARILRKRWDGHPFYILYTSSYLQSNETDPYTTLVKILKVPYTGFLQTGGMGEDWRDLFQTHLGYACDLIHAERSRAISDTDQLMQFAREAGFTGMVHEMYPMVSTLRKVASTDLPVLITGESGTGKEIAARALHHLSKRCAGRFVAINCGAIPKDLFESQCFGVEGTHAFSGAIEMQGYFETAKNGVIFLDEIGELPLDTQVKLLRVLESKKVIRVGGNTERDADFRLVAATNRDLEAMVRNEQFRKDLFYRINVVSVSMMRLQERGKTAILELAEHFLSTQNQLLGKTKRFSAGAKRKLAEFSWPGNIRQLQNVVVRACVLSDTDVISDSDFELSVPLASTADFKNAARHAAESSIKREAFLAELEAEYLTSMLTRYKGNKTKAAKACGITRETLHRRLKVLLSNDSDKNK